MRSLGLPSRGRVPASGRPCEATRVSQLLIDPQGSLYKCPNDLGRPERAYASVLPDRPLQPKNLLPSLAYAWFSHEECRACPLLRLFAGECPHRRMRGYATDFCLLDHEERADRPRLLRDHVAASRV
jgi:radical SAM protein with 4Fe4S-binding SPASM domain